MVIETLLTPEDVSEMLRVPVKTLYRWRHHGVGPPALKVGRHLRYRLADVEEYLAALASGGET
jgi:excisionase family DNA binding protein